jgi:hypothetical protein
MKRITLGGNKDEGNNKDEDRKTQIETIEQYNKMLKNLKVNDRVLNADIHELFQFFNIAFFNSKLEAVILEWS